MSKKQWFALLGLSLLMVFAVGCSNDDGPTTKTGKLSTYLQSGQMSNKASSVTNVTAINVTFEKLSVFDVSGKEASLISSNKTVDLVSFLNEPKLLAEYNIPVGNYNRVKAQMNGTGTFTITGGNTCTFSVPTNAFDLATPQGYFLTVTETGFQFNMAVGVELNGQCPTNGGPGTLSIGNWRLVTNSL